MSTHVNILSDEEKRKFDLPPKFTGEERKKYFYVPNWINDILITFRKDKNKILFLLQYAYFKATGKFFIAKNYRQVDIDYLIRKYDFKKSAIDSLDLTAYTERTYKKHQELILLNLGYKKFDANAKKILETEALRLSNKRTKPKIIFSSLIELLQSKKIEIPTYHLLSKVITYSMIKFEKQLLELINSNITLEEVCLLDNLLKLNENYLTEDKNELKIKRYKITLLKRSNQILKPSKIQENVKDLKLIQALYQELQPIIDKIELSPETIKYYAQVVIKSQVFQLNRRNDNKKYLLLIAFVIDHYYKLNDLLVEIFFKSVQSTINTSNRDFKESVFENRNKKNQRIKSLINAYEDKDLLVSNIKNIVSDDTLSYQNKVEYISKLIDDDQEELNQQLLENIKILRHNSRSEVKNSEFYAILEKKSRKLQNRVSNIIRELVFDKLSANKVVTRAIDYLKEHDFKVYQDAPIDFLENGEQDQVFSSDGKIKVSLYKAMLFEKISHSIKSGSLNIKYSYQYKNFDYYLIPKDYWESNKVELLEQSNLKSFVDFENVCKKYNKILIKQLNLTNRNTQKGKNKYIKVAYTNHFTLNTPKVDTETVKPTKDIFPQDKFIPLYQILTVVNKYTNFINSLEHWNIKYIKRKPSMKIFFAGIIGYGCNLGIRKTAKISKHITHNELENTVNWYFTIDNLNNANNKIIALIDKMKISKIFKRNKNISHTSSDGQKFSVGVESLNANYSFKYFGKGKGVTVYSFIDECHKLFHSTVISSSVREATYVIDGLMQNEVVKSDIHSTDTHGYNELIFGICHLLGISFAPRIKNFPDQYIYAFDHVKKLKEKGYQILPQKRIQIENIEPYWDDILRFVATIKLKHSTASQLFKRLSAYSIQHPFYKALKEFGKIFKSIFLLQYIDDVELRQMIEKQLNKLESSNKFRKAVFHGNNQEFQQASKEEQLIADTCSRLIQNAIICWNYLYISQKICDFKSESEREEFIEILKNKSIVTWQHINMLGEFNFSENFKSDITFELPKLLELNNL